MITGHFVFKLHHIKLPSLSFSSLCTVRTSNCSSDISSDFSTGLLRGGVRSTYQVCCARHRPPLPRPSEVIKSAMRSLTTPHSNKSITTSQSQAMATPYTQQNIAQHQLFLGLYSNCVKLRCLGSSLTGQGSFSAVLWFVPPCAPIWALDS